MIEVLEVPIRVKSPAISATLIRLINAHTHRINTHTFIYKIIHICIHFEFKMQVTILRADNIHPSLHKEH